MIVALVLIAYIPAMRAGFIWDDDVLLTNNPLIKSPQGWWQVWCSTDQKFYFPVTWTTFWLEWRLFGMDATGYHVVNILLHAAGALLLWRALTRLAVPGAWWGALLFALHPVNVESVAWISEHKNTLSLLFFLGTLLCYWRAEDANSRRWYWTAVGLFVLALLSKTTVVMLPVVLLLCAWWRRGRVTSDDWIRTGPLFLLALVSGLATLWFQAQLPADMGTDSAIGLHNPWLSAAMAGWTFWFYLFKTLFPIGLRPLYENPQLNAAVPLSYLPSAAWIGLLVVLWLYRRRWARGPFGGVGFFLVMLFPVIGIAGVLVWRIPPLADHILYLPVIGIVALVAAVVPRHRSYQAFAAVAVGGLAVLTWQQSRIYRDAKTYWLTAVERSPRHAGAHYNLAAVLMREHRYAAAEEQFAQTVALRPNFVLAYLNWGTLLAERGRAAEAVDKFERAVRLRPRWPQIHYNLALALSSLGQTREAIHQLEQTVVLTPDDAEVRYRFACLLINTGDLRRAATALRAVLRLNPAHAAAHYNLGLLLLRQQRLDEAYQHIAAAARLNPNDADARALLTELQRVRDRSSQ